MTRWVWLFVCAVLVGWWPSASRAEDVDQVLRDGKQYAVLGTEQALRQAIDIFKQSMTQYPNAAEAYVEAADAQMLLASMYGRNHKQNIFGLLSPHPPDPARIHTLYAEARTWILKALELAPQSADAHAIAALLHQNLEQPDEAKRLVEKALILESTNLRALRVYLTLIPEAQKATAEKRQRLVTHYKEALAQDPGNARGHVDLGLQYLAQKEKELAKQEFERAVQASPEYLYPYLYLGDCLSGYTTWLPWKKMQPYIGALKTSRDDLTLAWYYMIATVVDWMVQVTWYGIVFGGYLSLAFRGRRTLLRFAVSLFIFVCLPALLIVQYYAHHRFGTLWSSVAPLVSLGIYGMVGLLFVRSIIIGTGRSIYRHRFIYGMTEPLLVPLRGSVPDAWANVIVFGELYFLSTFFGKLFPRLLQLGQGPWM